jgi:O-antigen/teichoic acid export membrane protein
MTQRRRNIAALATLAAQHLGTQVLGLLRNILIARLLAPAETGTVAALTLVLTGADAITDLGVERLLIQSQAPSPSLLGAAQALQAVRGILVGLAIIVLSPCLAGFFHIPHAWPAFIAVAIAPMLRGFVHLQTRLDQRHMNFNTLAIADLVSILLSVCVAAVAGFVLKSHWTGVLTVVSQAATHVWLTHHLAKTKAQFVWDLSHLRQMLRFGWPVLINGLIVFLAMQGDRLAIGAGMGPKELGIFASIAGVVLVPGLALIKILSSWGLPRLAQSIDSQNEYQRRLDQMSWVLVAMSLFLFLTVSGFGKSAITLLFGQHYQLPGECLALLAGVVAIRMLREPASCAAVARADSINPLLSNLLRIVGVAVAFTLAYHRHGMQAVLITGFIFECLSLTFAALLLAKRHSVTSRPSLVGMALIISGTTVATVYPSGLLPFAFLILSVLLIRILPNVVPSARKFFIKLHPTG